MSTDIRVSNPSNKELTGLLEEVFVLGGHTTCGVAERVFQPDLVRQRGDILCTRNEEGALVGMVVLVPSTSSAAKFAGTGEVEMHLLAVSPRERSRGRGRALVTACVQLARSKSATRMVLWTQPHMKRAHRLYFSLGFTRVPDADFERDGKSFLVFEQFLS